MTESDSIRAGVHQLLTLAGINFEPAYRGERVKRDGGKPWTCDEWACVFVRGERGESVEFPFFMGIGNRSPAPMPTDGGPRPRAGTLMHEQLERMRKPVAPHAADVLYSLVLDSSAVGMSFAEWCAEYGYSDDSIKARGTYDECQRNADTLRRFFGAELLAKINNALGGY